jgi:hypothetical protein
MTAATEAHEVGCPARYPETGGDCQCCDCGKGEWCPQYGAAFKAAREEALQEAEVWCRRCPLPATETYNDERLCHDCALTLAYKIESPAWRR